MRNYHIVTLFVLLALFCNIKSFAIEKEVSDATQWQGKKVGMAHRMRSDHGDNVDAILIWAGTNDYNASRPIGDFFTENTEEVNVNGNMVQRKLTNFCNQNICLS